jgi:hypothetical protein
LRGSRRLGLGLSSRRLWGFRCRCRLGGRWETNRNASTKATIGGIGSNVSSAFRNGKAALRNASLAAFPQTTLGEKLVGCRRLRDRRASLDKVSVAVSGSNAMDGGGEPVSGGKESREESNK